MKILFFLILIFEIFGNEIPNLEGAYAIKEFDDIKWIEIYGQNLYLEKNSKKKKANLYFKKIENETNSFFYINIIINNTKLCINKIYKNFSFCPIDTDEDIAKWNLIKMNVSLETEEQIFVIQNILTKKFIGINSFAEENLPKTLLNVNNDIENATLFQFFKIYEEYIPTMTSLLEKEPIDVLIKYIDLKDKTLQRKNIKQTTKDFDNEELKYCLRSIFQNIPWVRKIFIIMPNEKIKFLKSQDEIKEKIIFVKDMDLIGFDSSAIHVFQFNLWKMKKFGMSENFLLMDDDYFINKPIKKEEFFYEENGQILPAMVTNDYYLINHDKLKIIYKDYLAIINNNKINSHSEEAFFFRQTSTLKFISSIFKNKTKENTHLIEASFSHNTIPLKLSDIKEVYDIVYKNYLFKNETLFALERNIYSLHFQTFILSYLINKYQRKVHGISCAYLDIRDYYKYERTEKLFVINKSDRDYDENFFYLEKIYLEKIFNISTKYELENKVNYNLDKDIIKENKNRDDLDKINKNIEKEKKHSNYMMKFLYFIIDFCIKKGLNKVKGKMTQAELEKKLNEATVNETGLASISLLNEISSRSDEVEECKIISKYCIKILGLKPKMWKRILRSLALIEHVLKTGSQNFVDQIKDERDKLKDLFEFKYEEEDKDRGEPSKLIYFIIYI